MSDNELAAWLLVAAPALVLAVLAIHATFDAVLWCVAVLAVWGGVA